MRVAFLILAHHQPGLLRKLVESLNYDWASFFIHVDKKTASEPFRLAVSAFKEVVFLPDRIPVHWGGFSMVEATLKLLKTANQSDEFDRFCLLSGSDFPIKKEAELRDLFGSEYEYMDIHDILSPGAGHRLHYRLDYCAIYDSIHWASRVRGLKRILLALFGAENGLFRIRRTSLEHSKFASYHGPTWWCLSRSCVRYILEFVQDNPEFSEFHKFTSNPDEVFFQSIVRNSRFGEKMHCDLLRWQNPPFHYIDWHKGPEAPRVLDLTDLPALIESKAAFARKFDLRRSASLFAELEKRRER